MKKTEMFVADLKKITSKTGKKLNIAAVVCYDRFDSLGAQTMFLDDDAANMYCGSGIYEATLTPTGTIVGIDLVREIEL